MLNKIQTRLDDIIYYRTKKLSLLVAVTIAILILVSCLSVYAQVNNDTELITPEDSIIGNTTGNQLLFANNLKPCILQAIYGSTADRAIYSTDIEDFYTKNGGSLYLTLNSGVNSLYGIDVFNKFTSITITNGTSLTDWSELMSLGSLESLSIVRSNINSYYIQAYIKPLSTLRWFTISDESKDDTNRFDIASNGLLEAINTLTQLDTVSVSIRGLTNNNALTNFKNKVVYINGYSINEDTKATTRTDFKNIVIY